MLIVLLGSSGAGKTTIMKNLELNHGFSPIMVRTSRAQRDDDYNKISGIIGNPTEETHEIQEAFGNIYVQSKEELRASAASSGNFMIDVSSRYFHNFLKYSENFFLIELPDMEEYKKRLSSDGRADRLHQMESEILASNRLDDMRIKRIVNYDSRETARLIAEMTA